MPELQAAAMPVICRELGAKEELREYFRIRYDEYPAARFQIRENRDRLDIEPYDFSARFVGAFAVEEGRERLIGGVRMVEREKQGPASALVREICLESADLADWPSLPRRYPFQLMDILDLRWLVAEYEKEGKRLVEFGRTVVHRAYRNTRVGSELVERILRIGRLAGADAGFGYCPEGLRRFYERGGCRAVERFYHTLHGWWAWLLIVPLKSGEAGDLTPDQETLPRTPG